MCRHCYDKPQQQLRAIVVPADPLPVIYPSPEFFGADETSLMTQSTVTIDPTTGIPVPGGTAMVTVTGTYMTPEPVGRPVGLSQNAVMPSQVIGATPTEFGEPLELLSVVASGTGQISVTCRSAHGLSTNSQVSVEGLTDGLATGFYSVTVTGAMGFNYFTYSTEPNGPLITNTTRIVPCYIGLPYGYETIPQVGP